MKSFGPFTLSRVPTPDNTPPGTIYQVVVQLTARVSVQWLVVVFDQP